MQMGNNNNDSHIEYRLDTIERRFDRLIDALCNGERVPEEPKELDKQKFAQMYNHAKYMIPVQNDMYVGAIHLHSRFYESAMKLLYPSGDDDGYYYPIGELSPLPISFQDNIDGDYLISCFIKKYF